MRILRYNAVLFVALVLAACLTEAKYFEARVEGGKGTWMQFVTKYSFDIGTGKANTVWRNPVQTIPVAQHISWGLVMDTNWADFKRRVEGGHCAVDLLNPRFPIEGDERPPQTLLSRTITTKLRPHVWYFVFHVCHSQGPVKVESWFEFLNNGNHYSYDDRGMLEAHLFLVIGFLLVFAFVSRTMHVNKKVINMTHPIIKVFLAALLFTFLGLLFEYIHLWQYQYNGRGSRTFDTLAEIAHGISELVVTALLTFMAWGWTIDTDVLPNKKILPVFGIMAVVHISLLLLAQTWYGDGHEDKHHDHETAFHLVVNVLRVSWYGLVPGAFYSGLARSRENSPKTGGVHQFWQYFTVLATIWFFSWPLVHVVAAITAPYLRHTVVTAGTYLVQISTLLFLCKLLLTRGQYFKISTLGSSILPSRMG